MNAPRGGGVQRRASASTRGEWLPLAGLTLLAAALRVPQLGSQLWLDEIAALGASIRRPAAAIASQWPGVGSHPLYELLAHAALVTIGDTPIAIRLPAALFGAAGVAAMYVLSANLLERRYAVAITALFAVSYHHVFYSQNARGYTALIFFFLVASHLVITFRREERISAAAGVTYAASGALATYSQLLGVFIVPAHVAVLAAEALARRGRGSHFPLGAYLRYAVLSGVITAALYAPFVGSIRDYVARNAATAAEGPRLGLWLLDVIVEGLAAAFFGPVGVVIAVAIGLVGVAAWVRRDALALGILLAPIAAQVAVLLARGVGIYPRYFAIAIPVLFLVGGLGAFTVIAFVVGRLPVRPHVRRGLEYAVLAAVVAVAAVPLARYYRTPKQDYLGALRVIDSLAAPTDGKVGVYLAEHVLNGYYGANLLRVETLDDLVAAERAGRRLWLVTTLERLLAVHDPALYQHIKTRYRLVRVLPATVGDGEMRIYGMAPPARS